MKVQNHGSFGVGFRERGIDAIVRIVEEKFSLETLLLTLAVEVVPQ